MVIILGKSNEKQRRRLPPVASMDAAALATHPLFVCSSVCPSRGWNFNESPWNE